MNKRSLEGLPLPTSRRHVVQLTPVRTPSISKTIRHQGTAVYIIEVTAHLPNLLISVRLKMCLSLTSRPLAGAAESAPS